MATYFFISISVFVAAIIGSVINAALAVGSRGISGSTFLIQGILVVLYAISGIASLIAGIIWIVQQFT